MKCKRHTLHNPAVWPVPYACAHPYHPGSGSHGQLFRDHVYFRHLSVEYRPTLGRYSTNISAECRSRYRPIVDRDIGRGSIEISVECGPTCRPIYRPTDAFSTQDRPQDPCFVLVRTHQDGIAVGQTTLVVKIQ